MEYAPGGELARVFKKFRVHMWKDGILIHSVSKSIRLLRDFV